MQRLRGLVAAALMLALAGCGGSPQKNIESVHSLAAEGALLARQSEHGDATAVFVRVHAGYLKQEADKLAHALAGQRELRASGVASVGRARPRAPPPRRSRFRRSRTARETRRAAGEMSKLLQIALGILAAIGGFVDIGDLVFNVEAGATFGYQLLWVVVVGVVGIIVYSEMCGRVAAVSKRPVFDAVRERMGFGVGAGVLIASEFVNLMTLAAEIGGVALAASAAGRPLLPRADRRRGRRRSAWRSGCCRSSGSSASSATWGSACSCSWSARSSSTPTGARSGTASSRMPTPSNFLLYAYFAVGLLGAAMTPYEVYFYSSGVVEEGWTPKDLGLNRANSMIGYAPRRRALLRADDHRRCALPAEGHRAPVHRDGRARRRRPARDDRAAARARRDPLRGRRRRDRHLPLRARTTSPSSSAGSGASTGGRPPRRGSRSPGSCCSCSPSWS